MRNGLILLMALISLSTNALDLAFSRDDRPVDGDYVVLSIKGEGKLKSVLLTTSFFSWDKDSLETDMLFGASSMSCTNWYYSTKMNNVLHSVDCVRDDRPVDGTLKEILIEINAQGTFDVTLLNTFYSRTTGKEVSESKVMAYDLELN